jgi:zinc transport system substrate-binding protein
MDMARGLFLSLVLFALIPSATAARAAEGVIYTVNDPLRFFASEIAGDEVEVIFPGPTGEDPAFWTPDSETLQAYQAADLTLSNGAGYAKWVDKAALPRARLVDTSAGFRDELIDADNAVAHAHGPEGAHAHGGTAFTTWLDPSLARAQAAAIQEAMARRWPKHVEAFAGRFAALEAALTELDANLAEATVGLAGRPILASHPIYQYLARHYGLDLRAMLWEPDETPSRAQWQAFEALLAEHPARVMLWEDEPTDETRARLESLGVTIIVFRSLASASPNGDFLAGMRGNITALTAVAPAE